jgi:hypothetical protein
MPLGKAPETLAYRRPSATVTFHRQRPDFRNPSVVEFVHLCMEYFDALRCSGWIDDPSDTVRVVTVHAEDCATTQGEACSCTPRLTLVPDAPRADRREERDLPWRDLASGE